MSGCSQTSNVNLDEFAQCLADKGSTLYHKDGCSYCVKQEEMFGASYAKLNTVNCKPGEQVCAIKQIQGTPTWILKDGTHLKGLQALNTLAEATGCELPKEEPEVSSEE